MRKLKENLSDLADVTRGISQWESQNLIMYPFQVCIPQYILLYFEHKVIENPTSNV